MDDPLYSYKVGETLIYEREPTNKHSRNAITAKNKVIGHVPEALVFKLFTFVTMVNLQSQRNHIWWEA